MPSPTKLNKNSQIPGTKYVEDFSFQCGNIVPVFDVVTHHGLNQLLGNAKYNNQAYGDVLYRGQCKIYDTVMPGLLRGEKKVGKSIKNLNSLIDTVISDRSLISSIGLSGAGNDEDRDKVEGLLQHYGVTTRNIDLVDNHWVALWMGLHKFVTTKQINKYGHYSKRIIDLPAVINSATDSTNIDQYQYILLMAIPCGAGVSLNGISNSDGFITVDLRRALPSVFLRPHAQHGIVVKKTGKDGNIADFYDLASQVVGILRFRIDIVDSWLGHGELLSMDNLFPPAALDQGYEVLLENASMIKNSNLVGCEITRYY